MDDWKVEARVFLNIVLRTIAWVMVFIALGTTTMTFLSTFRIYVTAAFSTAKTLIYVLMITFGVWTIRCIIDSKTYPGYKFYSVVFLILTLVAAYLLKSPVF